MSNLKVAEHNYLISHSVKTAILSIALAEFLKLPQHKIIELGAAALMHKIGMRKLPESIVTKPGGLKENEWNAIKAYPILGYKILQASLFPSALCLAVLEHQERNNGTGYPRKLAGEQISLYGKVLAVISSYCAAIEKRPFKSGKDAHTGIMDILKSMGKQYDEKIVRALIFTLSFYPIGTKVFLSNNSVAVVVKTNSSNPKEPVIKVLTNEEGEPLTDNVVIDLSQNKKLQISRLLTQSEIVKLSAK
jgi:HD-GYP domain-containing protein (c-di-GMP phosphodiesterase class II)